MATSKKPIQAPSKPAATSAPKPKLFPEFPLTVAPQKPFKLIGPAKVVFHTPDGAKKAKVITDQGTNTLIDSIKFELGSRCVAVEAHPQSKGLTIFNSTVTNGSLLDAELGGVEDVTVDGGGNPTNPTEAFGLIYLGGRAPNPPNRRITLQNLISAGSINEHCLRVHNTENLTVHSCQFRNPPKLNPRKSGRATYNLRDGSRFRVTGEALSPSAKSGQPQPQPPTPAPKSATIENQVILGPLADRDGGMDDILRAEKVLTLPPKQEPYTQKELDNFREEHHRKMALGLDGVLFENFYSPNGTGAYWILEAGLINCTIQNGVFAVWGGGGYAFSFQKQYGPWKGSPKLRQRPTNITLRNLWVTLPTNGHFFGGKAINLTVENCWYRFHDFKTPGANPGPYQPVTQNMVKYARA